MKKAVLFSALLFSQLCFAEFARHPITNVLNILATDEATDTTSVSMDDIQEFDFALNLEARETNPCTELCDEKKVY